MKYKKEYGNMIGLKLSIGSHRILTKFLEKALLFGASLLYTVSCNPPLPNLITIVKTLQKVKFLLRESPTSSQNNKGSLYLPLMNIFGIKKFSRE